MTPTRPTRNHGGEQQRENSFYVYITKYIRSVWTFLFPLSYEPFCFHRHVGLSISIDMLAFLFPLPCGPFCFHCHMNLSVFIDMWGFLFPLHIFDYNSNCSLAYSTAITHRHTYYQSNIYKLSFIMGHRTSRI